MLSGGTAAAAGGSSDATGRSRSAVQLLLRFHNTAPRSVVLAAFILVGKLHAALARNTPRARDIHQQHHQSLGLHKTY
jgi:hypothetical protein